MIYTELFSVIRNHVNQYPQSILTDFELSAINSISSQYNSDEEFKLNLKFFPSLAFVPTDDIIQAYDEVIFQQFFEQNSDFVS
ncbi:hypothetical protein HZS_2999 [Henneguya salminicola]|nr:hypothetical protein HZS_2999 [Henneguya salminicola]